jgi:hypothetical protein
MQISGVCLALTWPRRLCLLRVLCSSGCYKLSPFQAHCGRWHCTHFLRRACLFTAHVGNRSSPLSCGVFLSPPLLQAFPLLVAGRGATSAFSSLACVFTVLWGIPLPTSSALSAPHLCAHVFFVLIAYYSVSLFFPGWGSVCPGGYADLAQGCLWEYHVPLHLPCGLHLPKLSVCWCLAVARGALLVSLFNMKWRCLHRPEVWRGQSFACPQWFCL